MSIFPKKPILIFAIAILLCGGLFASWPAGAANLPSLVPQCQNNPGGCNVCDAIGVGINITKIMLGTLGSAALLMFVYGGVMMATSRGHSDQVQKGKDALTNAVKGVIIVLASWVVINYGLAMMLGPGTSFNEVKIFSGANEKPWYQTACKSKKCEDVPNHSCQDITTLSSEKAASCQKNLCPGGVSNQCCPD